MCPPIEASLDRSITLHDLKRDREWLVFSLQLRKATSDLDFYRDYCEAWKSSLRDMKGEDTPQMIERSIAMLKKIQSGIDFGHTMLSIARMADLQWGRQTTYPDTLLSKVMDHGRRTASLQHGCDASPMPAPMGVPRLQGADVGSPVGYLNMTCSRIEKVDDICRV